MIVQADAPPSFRWDRLTYSSALGYCLLVAGLSIGVVLGELRDQFRISGVVAALHGSTFGIGLLFAGVFGVRLVDRIGRVRALRLSAAGLAGGVVVFCVGPSWPITLLGTAFTGLGGALLVMVMPGLISDHHGEHRAQAFAAVNAAPGVAGVAFSLVVGAALSAGWSWRPPYLVLTAVFTIALAVVALPVRVPEGQRQGTFSLRHFRDREVMVPWLFIVNAVLAEFSVGIWIVAYLREVGHASAGLAPIIASVFGVMMFATRVTLPTLLRVWGDATISYSFVIIGLGATVMCLGPGLAWKTAGLVLVGFGAAPLYPLTVDRFYHRADHALDAVALGAYCALASGVAVTLGPLALGVLADAVGLRWALLVVPALATVGAVTQRPRH
ncbi:MAG TPA: MFS transporter [Ilumatobacteraceae bacterium]|nr:MFS transporter [Ilumatobacteraceae bacterium]